MSETKSEPKIVRGTVPTHWQKPTVYDEYGMVKVRDKAPVMGVGQKVVAIMESRGDEVTVSQPHCYWERMIDREGNVLNCPLAGNRTPTGFTREDLVEIAANRTELVKAGWYHYDSGFPKFGGMPEVGVPSVSSPEWIRFRDVTQGAEVDDNGVPRLGPDGKPIMKPGLIAERRAKHLAKTEAYKAEYERDKEKHAEDLLDILRQFTTTIGGAMTGEKRPTGRRVNPGLVEE